MSGRGRLIVKNRRATYEYEILERFEAGIVLLGTEVKSIREGRVSISEAYSAPHNGELYIYDMHIGQYPPAGARNHEPRRPRKLLLHRHEIKRLMGKVEERGLTLIPLRLYTNNKGVVKLEIALARGRAKRDRREEIKRRDLERERRRYGAL